MPVRLITSAMAWIAVACSTTTESESHSEPTLDIGMPPDVQVAADIGYGIEVTTTLDDAVDVTEVVDSVDPVVDAEAVLKEDSAVEDGVNDDITKDHDVGTDRDSNSLADVLPGTGDASRDDTPLADADPELESDIGTNMDAAVEPTGDEVGTPPADDVDDADAMPTDVQGGLDDSALPVDTAVPSDDVPTMVPDDDAGPVDDVESDAQSPFLDVPLGEDSSDFEFDIEDSLHESELDVLEEETSAPSDVMDDTADTLTTLPELGFPQCQGPESATPCWRFRSVIFEPEYTNDFLPDGVALNSFHTAPRSPTAPTLTFDGRILVAGGKLKWVEGWNFIPHTAVIYEFDSDGAETAKRYPVSVSGPVDCLTVLDGATYFLGEANGVSRRNIGAQNTWPILDTIIYDVINKGGQNCIAAASNPGWIIASTGVLKHKLIHPWKSYNAPTIAYGPGGSRTPAVCDPWIWTAGDVYDVSIYDLWCEEDGCSGNHQGTGTSGGEPIPDELAVDSNCYAVIGTTGHRLWVAGLSSEVMTPPGAFAATPVVGAGNIAFIGSTNGFIYAISTDSPYQGLQWKTDTGAPVRSAATLSENGLLYVANEAPALFAIAQATGEIQWQIALPGRPAIRSYPLTSEGWLYVTAGKELISIQVEPGGLADAPWPKTGFDNHLRYNQTLDPDVPQF